MRETTAALQNAGGRLTMAVSGRLGEAIHPTSGSDFRTGLADVAFLRNSFAGSMGYRLDVVKFNVLGPRAGRTYRFSDVMREVGKNAAMAAPAVKRLRARRGRTVAADARDQARHLRAQFAFFMGTLGSVQGKSIVEIGPGDTAALGALFLQAGAISYTAFDRFDGDVSKSYARSLYRELGCQLPDLAQGTVIRRTPIEDVDPSCEQRVDIIVSFNAIEHLIDPHVAVRKMAGMLKPDGVMVHRVDYGPHDLWASSENPMTFLVVPERLWALMGSNRGYPNRERHAELMRTASDLGLNVVARVTGHFKAEEMDELRASLQLRFHALSDQDMLVRDAEFTCARGSPLPLGPTFPY